MKNIAFFVVLMIVSCSKSSYQQFVEINNPQSTAYFYINSPVDNQSVMKESLTVSGIATDRNGVAKIEVVLNNVAYPTSGQTDWSANVALSEGTNILFARATLQDSTVKETVPIKIHYRTKLLAAVFPIEASEPEFMVNNNTAYIFSGETNDPGDPVSSKLYSFDLQSENFSIQPYSISRAFSGNGVFYKDSLYVLNGLQNRKTLSNPSPKNNNIYLYGKDGAYKASYSASPSSLLRDGAGMAVVGGMVYIFGGYDSNNQISNKIIQYNLESATGNLTEAGFYLEEAVAYPQIFVYNGKIYIFGGLTSSQKYSKKFQVFTPGVDIKSIANPLIYNRCGGSVLVDDVNKKAYVVGGEHFYNQQEEMFQSLSNKVELIDLANMTSQEIVPLGVKLGYFGAAYYGGKIYLFGGSGEGSGNDKAKKDILVYMPDK